MAIFTILQRQIRPNEKVTGDAKIHPPVGGEPTLMPLTGNFSWVGAGGHAFTLMLTGAYRDDSRATSIRFALVGMVEDWTNFCEMDLKGAVTQMLADGHGTSTIDTVLKRV